MPERRTCGPSTHQIGPSPSHTLIGVQAKPWPAGTIAAAAKASTIKSVLQYLQFSSFAGHPVVVAVETGPVAGIPAPQRRRPGSPCRCAVGIVGIASQQAVGAGTCRRSFRSRCAVAVITAVLAVVMATLSIETAGMRRGVITDQGNGSGNGQQGESHLRMLSQSWPFVEVVMRTVLETDSLN